MEKINKIKRKKFFTTVGTGITGFFIFSSFPFNLFGKKDLKNKKIKVEINPLAVKRNNLGENNV